MKDWSWLAPHSGPLAFMGSKYRQGPPGMTFYPTPFLALALPDAGLHLLSWADSFGGVSRAPSLPNQPVPMSISTPSASSSQALESCPDNSFRIFDPV